MGQASGGVSLVGLDGLPHTRAENADLLIIAPHYAVNVDGYCRRVSWLLVR